ncbi:translation elongation factor Ts [Patescibacteria group bacterium]|nr:translation elongation factor Ts [Patescibacteria group bacterium]
MIKAKDIANLRNETGAGVMDCKKALIKANGNKERALKILQALGKDKAKKRTDRMTEQGLIECYVHKGSRIGVMVEVVCETDFVARTDDFKKLAHNIAMQVASMGPKNVKELLGQIFIFDDKKKISDLVEEVITKTGEKCEIKRFERFELGG